MLNLHLIVLGKLKESYWRDAETEYLKRLRPYTKITLTEIPEEPFREHDDKEKIKEKEALKLRPHLPDAGIVIALHERGREYTSPEFAGFLQEHSTRGEKLTFIIGGPLGLHESVLQSSQQQISLSSLTFPHQMARTILLEQIYRGVTIAQGKRYHY